MGLKADLPYPSLDGVKKDCRSLRIVSPAYAGREGELTATLQYVYQSIYLSQCGNEKLAHLLMDIAITEMHHIEILGGVVTRLGAPPIFTSCPPYPVGYYSASNVNYNKNPESMLEIDIAGERGAIACYERMLVQLCDPAVSEIITRIIADEKVHLAALEEALKSLSHKE